MIVPDSPMQTIRADELVVGDTLAVPMTESIETVTAITVGAYVSVHTDGTGPDHAYVWAASEELHIVSRDLCRCDWLGAGTPEHVRSGLCREVTE